MIALGLEVIAHGVGSRGDLPLPLWQFAWAATAALVISFVVLGAAWKRPRLADAAAGITLSDGLPFAETRHRWATAFFAFAAIAARIVGLGLYILTIAAAWFGENATNANIAPVTIYVILWIGVPLFSAFVIDPWPWASPFDTITAGLSRLHQPREATAPPWSLWLAPIGAAYFLVMELIVPDGAMPRQLALAMTAYSIMVLLGAWRWGRAWLAQAELFAVFFGLVGAMAPLGVDRDGTVRLRWPFSGLGRLKPPPSATATALVILGGTSFDGFVESTVGKTLLGDLDETAQVVALLAMLALSIGLVAGLYLFAARFAASVSKTSTAAAISDYTPSLLPIVIGYLIAHYAQLLVDEVQTFAIRLSDPFGLGWDLFGTATNTVDYSVISVDAIAWVQALAIVFGHVIAVLVAHDRALERNSPAAAGRSQHAMLVVMVIYSIGGLWLLLNA